MAKIRAGFVSNSSTTSFCIIGCTYEYDDIDWENSEGIVALVRKERGEEGLEVDDISMEDVGEAICEQNEGLSYECDGDNDILYIGIAPANDMKDDQTLGDFKKQAQDLLAQAGLPKKEIEWMIEGWPD